MVKSLDNSKLETQALQKDTEYFLGENIMVVSTFPSLN